MGGMKAKAGETETHHQLTEDQLMELTNLTIEDDTVRVDMTAHEIADVELRFES